MDEPSNTLPNLTKAVVVAGGAFVIDALVINVGVLGIVMLLFLFPVMLVRARRVKGDAPLYKRHVTVTALYLISAVGILLSIYINNSMAINRAERIIEACDRYNAEIGAYPDDLYDLIPDFIDRIPKAKHTYMNSRFSYGKEDGRHVLSFKVLPPSGINYYTMEEGKWGFRN
jgi:predicted PurR-regulated permease PerM